MMRSGFFNMKEKFVCEVCKKKNEFVRFEGSEEKFICDNCLIEMKGGIK